MKHAGPTASHLTQVPSSTAHRIANRRVTLKGTTCSGIAGLSTPQAQVIFAYQYGVRSNWPRDRRLREEVYGVCDPGTGGPEEVRL